MMEDITEAKLDIFLNIFELRYILELLKNIFLEWTVQLIIADF